MASRMIDLTGNEYGRLTVVKISPWRSTTGAIKWVCDCSCGNTKTVVGGSLKNGSTQSCGCILKERFGKDEQDC